MIGVSYILIIIAAVILILSVEVLIAKQGPLNVSSSVFIFLIALITGSVGLYNYLLCYSYNEAALYFFKLKDSLVLLIGPALYFLSLFFPRGEYKRQKSKNVIIYFLIFLIPAVLFFLGWDIKEHSIEIFTHYKIGLVYQITAERNIFYWIANAGTAALSVYAFVKLVINYSTVKLVYQRRQIRYFLAGSVLFVIIFIAVYLLRNWLSFSVMYIIGGFNALIYASVIIYTIINYRFFSLRKTSVRLLRELSVGMVILSPIVLFFYMIRKWTSEISPWLFFIIFIPTFTLLFRLVKSITNLVKSTFEQDDGMKDFTAELLESIENSHHMSELGQNSIEALLDIINCRNADFLVFDWKAGEYKVTYSATGRDYSISKNNPFLKCINKEFDFYERELINIDPRFKEIKVDAENYFSDNGVQLLLPCYYENELVSLIHVSAKQDDSLYTSREMVRLSRYKKAVTLVQNEIISFEKEQESKMTLRDLDLASEIQASIFQHEMPYFEKIDIFAYLKPVKWVSGDYYHVEKIDEWRLGFLLADVSGKGISAALIAMIIHSVASTQEFSSMTTNAIVFKINELMTSNIHISGVTKVLSFATMFCGYVDLEEKTLYYTNAGHLPMMILDCDTGKITEIAHNCRPVGIFQNTVFPTETYHFDRNQVFVVYSDGITEANNDEFDEFGEERLKEALSESRQLPAEDISKNILKAVDIFTGGKEQMDDITLLVMKL